MPHRVTAFLRSSSTSLEAQVASLKKATSAARKTSPSSGCRQQHMSQRALSRTSSLDDDADDADSSNTAPGNMRTMTVLQRPSERRDSGASQSDHHHRLSLSALHFGRSSRESHTSPNLTIDWKIESPPIVLYGDSESSTGALVSGLLFLNVKEEALPMESFNAFLNIHVTQKRPFTSHCHDCIHRYTELQKWSFLQAPLTLTKGRHAFPFSVLLQGHLPASMDSSLVSIAYEFNAIASPHADCGMPAKLEKLFDVKRSLLTPDLPHHSVRVFPPTNIKASVHFPQVIHPIGQNNMTLRLDGITRLNEKVNTLEYWKLKKLTWRLEETSKTMAPSCERHMPQEPGQQPDDIDQPSPKKGLMRTDTRIIGERTLLNGWKTSSGGPDDSCIEFDLEYALNKHAKYACDAKAKDGTEVTHQLMVEMVVSQEWAPVGKPSMVTQTGVGRILRMHFNVVLTERGGMGVSWDNEAPPIYQDVPPSPPSYSRELGGSIITDHIESLDYESNS